MMGGFFAGMMGGFGGMMSIMGSMMALFLQPMLDMMSAMFRFFTGQP